MDLFFIEYDMVANVLGLGSGRVRSPSLPVCVGA